MQYPHINLFFGYNKHTSISTSIGNKILYRRALYEYNLF